MLRRDDFLTAARSASIVAPICFETNQLRVGIDFLLRATSIAHPCADEPQSRQRRLKRLKREVDPDGRVVLNKDDGDIAYFACRLRDIGPEGHVETLFAFAVSDVGHLQVSIYFDDIADEAKALAFVDSIRFAGEDPSAAE